MQNNIDSNKEICFNSSVNINEQLPNSNGQINTPRNTEKTLRSRKRTLYRK